MSKNIAILDPLLGDNGKGHHAHNLSPLYRYILRASGSSNCGHQVYRNGKKYTHHLLPSADYRNKEIRSFLGSGMYINLQELFEEIQLVQQDFPEVAKSIYVDQDAFVITEENIRLDKENNKHIGSTGKGVGPAATDKFARKGSRIYNYINNNAEIIQKLKKIGVNFTTLLAMREDFEKSNLLFEGAQGVMLDINSGLYPYVSCGDATVSGIYSSGFNFIKLDKVYGVIKPYLTKAGSPGPLPTEMSEEDAAYWRKQGNEIGATTSRPRRIGYLDLPMLKYGILRGGITHLIISKMDIMAGQRSIKTCVSYGKEVYSPNDFSNIKPQYIDLPGWKDPKDYIQIHSFIQYIQDYTKTPIEYISAGVNPGDIMNLTKSSNQSRKDPFDGLKELF